MIKRIQIKHVVIVMLSLMLVVPMLNLASLYGGIQPEGIHKAFLPYLLGVAFETSVVICLWGDKRILGIFFAILSCIYGMLYHIDFDDIRNFDNWYKKSFLVPAFIQFGISSVGYFLAEFLILLIRLEKKAESIKDLIKQETGLQQVIAGLQQFISNLQQEVIRNEQKVEQKKQQIETLDLEEQNKRNVIAELDHTIEQRKQEIITLQKTKAGMSRKSTARKAQ